VARRPDYIVVGRFGRPRGVSGEISITPATDNPARFLELTELFIVDRGERSSLRLEAVMMINNRPVVKIEGIDSREAAARLTDLLVEIPMEKARPLPSGSYYQFDLVGCEVIGADGTAFGVVEEILFYPASDVYRIISDRFGEVLFPVVSRFVIGVDIEQKRIIIDPPKGLFSEKEDKS